MLPPPRIFSVPSYELLSFIKGSIPPPAPLFPTAIVVANYYPSSAVEFYWIIPAEEAPYPYPLEGFRNNFKCSEELLFTLSSGIYNEGGDSVVRSTFFFMFY